MRVWRQASLCHQLGGAPAVRLRSPCAISGHLLPPTRVHLHVRSGQRWPCLRAGGVSESVEPKARATPTQPRTEHQQEDRARTSRNGHDPTTQQGESCTAGRNGPCKRHASGLCQPHAWGLAALTAKF